MTIIIPTAPTPATTDQTADDAMSPPILASTPTSTTASLSAPASTYARGRPLHDRVVVRLLPILMAGEEQKTAGGLILVAPADGSMLDNPVREALVLAVGDGEVLFDGTLRQLSVTPGQRVLLHTNEVLPFKPILDPSELVEGLISERQILMVLT